MSFGFNSACLAAAPDLGYGPIGVLLLVVVAAGVVMLLLTHFLPKKHREGRFKDSAYESGVPPIGDARRRFNVKFYLVAMMFLIFDVELIFVYPWAMAFLDAKGGGAAAAAQLPMLFWVMMIFMAYLVIGLLYEWGKGILDYQ
ncbi:MAG TPA: NADH-quinone oxidoreductase subunit A [Phycisphaerae bacterium]|nr:NADH-quinone oxidoreductase subunit A [Phycisphaerae bacterium]